MGDAAKKGLKKGALTLLNAREFNNLRTLELLRRSLGGAHFDFTETAGRQHVSRLECGLLVPSQTPGLHFHCSNMGAPFLPLLAAQFRLVELESSLFLQLPHMWPLPVTRGGVGRWACGRS